MTQRKNKSGQGRTIALVILGLINLVLLIALLLHGTDVALFNPKGLIAGEQFRLILFTITVLLTIGIPSLVILYSFAWKYRESNTKATYDPHVRHGKFFVVGLWAIPCAFMLILASVMWPATHRLEPQKPIPSGVKPLTIQVVALRWKWLFIYPEQHIATVNFVQIPTNTPIQFELTADETPMSSFWIPHLGGQLYAMTGHTNRLNLLADTPGDYPGRSAEINGPGFAGMKFTARAGSQQSFDLWVQDVRRSPDVLDSATYKKLLAPSENNAAAFYAKAEADLYDKMLMKYTGSHEHTSQPADPHHMEHQ